MNPPGYPQRNDEPAALRSLSKGMRCLTLKHASQRGVSHRYQRKLGKGAPLARLQSDHLIAFGQPERDGELVEGQKLRALLRNQLCNKRRVRRGCQQARNPKQRLRRRVLQFKPLNYRRVGSRRRRLERRLR